jgi:hypothetical protein
MLISVDFDGTCVSHEFPHIGKNIGAEIVLKALSDAGHDIICMTMRSPKDKERWNIETIKEAKKWFKDNNIKLYAFNDNPSQESWSDSRKIYAHTYIDDQFLGCPLCYNMLYGNRVFVDWYAVSGYLNMQGALSSEVTNKIREELKEKYPLLFNKQKNI